MLDVSNVTAVAPGMNFILFLKDDGTVWACGDNRCGELGDGGNTSSYDHAVRVGDLSDVKMIAASGSTGMALKGDGTVWAWGSNNYGELGTGGTPGLLSGGSYSFYPVQVPISDVTSITAGDGNFFALKSDGTLWGWGSDDEGSLGVDVSDSGITVWTDISNNTRAVAAKPIQIPISGVTAISSNGE
ncbi:RCC1 domain-containing protein, partial [Methanocella conradii]|uniref:RCC1 domain-containing protein n=1 Tax=Methanocella conradii TaxID=1175444 RepID=UPI003D172C57